MQDIVMEVNSNQVIYTPPTNCPGAPWRLLPPDVFVTQLNTLLLNSMDSILDLILIFSEIVYWKPFLFRI